MYCAILTDTKIERQCWKKKRAETALPFSRWYFKTKRRTLRVCSQIKCEIESNDTNTHKINAENDRVLFYWCAICSVTNSSEEANARDEWGKKEPAHYALLCIIRSKIISANISLGEGGLKSHSSCTRIHPHQQLFIQGLPCRFKPSLNICEYLRCYSLS